MIPGTRVIDRIARCRTPSSALSGTWSCCHEQERLRLRLVSNFTGQSKGQVNTQPNGRHSSTCIGVWNHCWLVLAAPMREFCPGFFRNKVTVGQKRTGGLNCKSLRVNSSLNTVITDIHSKNDQLVCVEYIVNTGFSATNRSPLPKGVKSCSFTVCLCFISLSSQYWDWYCPCGPLLWYQSVCP